MRGMTWLIRRRLAERSGTACGSLLAWQRGPLPCGDVGAGVVESAALLYNGFHGRVWWQYSLYTLMQDGEDGKTRPKGGRRMEAASSPDGGNSYAQGH